MGGLFCTDGLRSGLTYPGNKLSSSREVWRSTLCLQVMMNKNDEALTASELPLLLGMGMCALLDAAADHAANFSAHASHEALTEGAKQVMIEDLSEFTSQVQEELEAAQRRAFKMSDSSWDEWVACDAKKYNACASSSAFRVCHPAGTLQSAKSRGESVLTCPAWCRMRLRILPATGQRQTSLQRCSLWTETT